MTFFLDNQDFAVLATMILYWILQYQELEDVQKIVKPFVLLQLIWKSYSDKNLKQSPGYRIFILLGFIFSLFGDVFLIFQFQIPSFFLLGLISFALAHVFYIIAFSMDSLKRNKANQVQKRFETFLGMFFVVFSISFYYYLEPNLKEKLKIPVFVYALLLSIMTTVCLQRKGLVNQQSFILVAIGSISFLLSDVLLALFLFAPGFRQLNIRISNMFFYFIGQYLIYKGVINQASHLQDTKIINQQNLEEQEKILNKYQKKEI